MTQIDNPQMPDLTQTRFDIRLMAEIRKITPHVVLCTELISNHPNTTLKPHPNIWS